MKIGRFIFSEKRGDRIKRHLLFWAVWALYLAVLHAASPFLKPASSYFSNLPSSIVRSFLMLIPQVFVTYAVVYIAVPLYTRKRQLLLALLCLAGAWVVSSTISIQMAKTVNPKILSWLLPIKYYRYMDVPPKLPFFIGLLTTKGVLTTTGFVVLLRYVKQWYIKEQRNLQLQKENIASQLQLLTAQVHPNFLFNTLHNIFSQTQNESPKGSKMIRELSDMLQYILAEGSKALVPLQKELAMIRDYINLEKLRYGNKLELHLSVPQETGNLQIPPLLLLPFVENCFKHGASKFLSAPWINWKIELNGRTLLMKLMNGKDPDHRDVYPKSGIGIGNVKKRLDLLYKDHYDLQITDEAETFVVTLRLELAVGRQLSEAGETITTSLKSIKPNYA